MAKAARGLPADFMLNLPDEKPVIIGDFLDEAPPPVMTGRKSANVQVERAPEQTPAPSQFRPEIVPERMPEVGEKIRTRPVARSAQQPSVIRYQLNLTPKSKTILEELVKYVRTYSPQSDARTSEVFQGIMTLLHNAMNELELSELPRRGAWGSVTAKNFPSALSEEFERAIVRAARSKGGLG